MTRRLRILVVDDHAGVRKAVSRLLACNHEVVGSIAEGSEVLDAAQRLGPDVIVLDINLPGVGGMEICRQLTQSNPALKVVMFTAADEPEVRRRAIEAGASAVVNKLACDGGLLAAIERLGADQD